MKKLSLTLDTVGSVARGHPWVYRDGLVGSAVVGDPVELVDGKGKRVAWGLFEGGPIAARVLGREPVSIDVLLKRRLRQALVGRMALFDEHTNAFRWCNGEGDGLGGLVLDRYGEVVVIRVYSKAWERHLGLVTDTLRSMGVSAAFRRFGVGTVDGKEGGEVLYGAVPDAIVVQEYGMKLLARVREGQKTGLFLDQRENRRAVRSWAKGLSVTNLFSYNGGFSIAAALGGAKRVLTVDQAPGAIDDARAIFKLNGVDPGAHGFEVADVFGFVGPQVDLVVCDPPSLSHGKEADAAARRAYRDLHRHLRPSIGRFLATASCSARLSWDRWEDAVREGLTHQNPQGTRFQRIFTATEPADHPVLLAHPEARYLKFMLLTRLEDA